MSDYSSLDDNALLERIAERDQQALNQLYERYGTPVYSLALQVLRSQANAEEITQDTFMKVWNNPHQYDANKGRFISWLLTVTRYTAIDRLRSEMRQATTNADGLDYVNVVSKIGIPEDASRRDNQLIRDLITQLPPEQAMLVQLGFLRGLTHRELSEQLDIPLGTVKTRVRLGLQKLKALWLEAHQNIEDK